MPKTWTIWPAFCPPNDAAKRAPQKKCRPQVRVSHPFGLPMLPLASTNLALACSRYFSQLNPKSGGNHRKNKPNRQLTPVERVREAIFPIATGALTKRLQVTHCQQQKPRTGPQSRANYHSKVVPKRLKVVSRRSKVVSGTYHLCRPVPGVTQSQTTSLQTAKKPMRLAPSPLKTGVSSYIFHSK